jgi:hypothetical protein
VVDLRLYRIALLPALPALVALLFSLQSLPGPLSPLVSPAAFSRATAANYAREIVAKAPDRTPGSAGDAAAADMVERVFSSVKGGEVSDQTFSSSGVDMRNVVLRLSGSNDRVVALIAPRDTAGGTGATTSAAATGILMELATELGAANHGATLILASTDGSTRGDAGAKQLADGFLRSGNVDGVIALAAPGVTDPHPPYLVDTSDGSTRTGVQLERTAERALREQAGLAVERPGALAQLGRLAVPGGLGEQAPLIERGIDAVTLSGAGELPVPASEQSLDSLSAPTIGAFGRTAFDILLSLDSAGGGTEASPGSYIEVGGNLVPGWAIAVLALALILPALVAAVDALARSSRGGHAGEAIAWAALRAAPLAAALLLLYVLALVGLMPGPAFPFDPDLITIGPTEVLVIALLVATAVLVWRQLGKNRVPAGVDPRATASALGGLSCISVIAIWVANPFLGLLAVPLAHVWILQARPQGARSRLFMGFSVLLAFAPIAIAIASTASRLGLGISLPWQTLVTVADGGLTPLVAIASTGLIAWVGALPVACGLPPSQAWTDSRSGRDPSRSIYPVERRNGPTGGNQDDGKPPGRETEEVERADSTRPVPGRLERGGGGDPSQDEPDQGGSSGDPASRI